MRQAPQRVRGDPTRTTTTMMAAPFSFATVPLLLSCARAVLPRLAAVAPACRAYGGGGDYDRSPRGGVGERHDSRGPRGGRGGGGGRGWRDDDGGFGGGRGGRGRGRGQWQQRQETDERAPPARRWDDDDDSYGERRRRSSYDDDDGWRGGPRGGGGRGRRGGRGGPGGRDRRRPSSPPPPGARRPPSFNSSPSSPTPLPPLADLRAEARFLVTCHPGASQFLADELRALLPPGSAAQRSVEERRGGSMAGAVAFSVPLLSKRTRSNDRDDENAEQPGVGEREARRLARRAVLRLRTATRVLELVGEADLDPRRAAGDTVYEAVRGFEEEEEEGSGSNSRRATTTTTSAPFLRRGWASLLPGSARGKDNNSSIGTLGVKAQLWANSNVSNSQLVAKRVRDACLDAVREQTGRRPAPPPPLSASSSSSSAAAAPPDLPLFAHLTRDRLSLYRDWAGGSLHRRGYRRGAPVHKAALNESAAAALLAAAGWWDPSGRGQGVVDAVLSGNDNQSRLALLDPMCGSGTMLVEAALAAVGAAPGLLRCEAAAADDKTKAHAFERWPDHERKLWEAELEEARQERREGERAWRAAAAQVAASAEATATTTKRKKAAAAPSSSSPPPPLLLFGGDVDERALSLARHAVKQARVEDLVGFWHGPCAERDGKALCEAAAAAAASGHLAAAPPRLAVANPPWGVRLLPWEAGEDEEGYLFDDEEEEEDDDQSRGRGGPRRDAPSSAPSSAADAEAGAQGAWDDLRAALKAAAAVGGDPDATLSAWVLSGNDRLSLGLRSERKRVLLAGGRKLAWLHFLVRPPRGGGEGGGGGGGGGGGAEGKPKPRTRSSASSSY